MQPLSKCSRRRAAPRPDRQYDIVTGRLRRKDSTAASAMSCACSPSVRDGLYRLSALECEDE